jgi:hypothetical protein
MRNDSWPRAAEFAKITLRLEPPDSVKANVLEWLAIANIEQGGDPELARSQFLEALQISPESSHVQKNFEHLKEHVASNRMPPHIFRVEMDFAGGAEEISELAA